MLRPGGRGNGRCWHSWSRNLVLVRNHTKVAGRRDELEPISSLFVRSPRANSSAPQTPVSLLVPVPGGRSNNGFATPPPHHHHHPHPTMSYSPVSLQPQPRAAKTPPALASQLVPHNSFANSTGLRNTRSFSVLSYYRTGPSTQKLPVTFTTSSSFLPPTKSHQQQRTAMSTSDSALSVEEQAKLVESSKRLAAYQAVKDYLDPSYTRVGIGSGSTVVYVVEAIAALGPAVTSAMVFYPTGAQSEELIEAAGLTMQPINKLPSGQQLDVAFDGADEVDEDLNLIKGGGACLWQEKLVATAAKKFVCVADFRKLSPRLGTSWKKGIPIEVLPMAAPRVLDELKRIGSHSPKVRLGLPGKAGAIVTDNGMWIIDAPFAPLSLPRDGETGIDAGNEKNGVWTVDALADHLIKIPGVAETGLFYGKNGLEVATGAQKPVAAYFGMADGTVEKKLAV